MKYLHPYMDYLVGKARFGRRLHDLVAVLFLSRRSGNAVLSPMRDPPRGFARPGRGRKGRHEFGYKRVSVNARNTL